MNRRGWFGSTIGVILGIFGVGRSKAADKPVLAVQMVPKKWTTYPPVSDDDFNLLLPDILQDVPHLKRQLDYERRLDFDFVTWRGVEIYLGTICVTAVVCLADGVEHDLDKTEDCLRWGSYGQGFLPVEDKPGAWAQWKTRVYLMKKPIISPILGTTTPDGLRYFTIEWEARFESVPIENHHPSRPQTLMCRDEKLKWVDVEAKDA